ncbi:GntR family transcriptional regulator [Siphonobacter sp. SORGH_AS_1065]|uniref:GntR family transcriptional regulator n=1 Tax=Siphonobacter sp. SORGH_AS_1065 TaxID=3041795 RepID=UPI002789B0C8|nr:GntR family transcriptional regulator [Siphonobacter sp. SORGH_AS_1065]MDQ1088052.1 DNA-binding transcriptional regulator YhcF (GntR family) [Siphonobacter sp. SORGH_AS_1065]
MKQTVRQVFEIIQIDEYSTTPKYKQIVNSVISAIERGLVKTNQGLPSINELSMLYDISRDTAEKAYNELKKLGILGSVPGKGFYIASASYRQKRRVFLLFNKLSPHKKIIYDTMVEVLGEETAVDFYVYNNNFRLFKELIQNRAGHYTHYVIIAHFLEGGESAAELVNHLPKEQLLILDKLIPGVEGDYASVYQDFEKDIFTALTEGEELLRKYQTLKLIFPLHTYHAREILIGFQKFCTEFGFPYKIISDVSKELMSPGDVYINLMEDDLVTLVKQAKSSGLTVGQDVGIISYNESPLKEIILDGITVLSTDFEAMGKQAAELILKNSTEQIANPFRLIVRKSV